MPDSTPKVRCEDWSILLSEEEVWYDVPDWEYKNVKHPYKGFYQVSQRGRVKGLARTVWTRPKNGRGRGHFHPLRERLLKGSTNKVGYVTVELSGGVRFSVHELVLTTFVGPRPPGMQCRHLDGDPSNNHVSNLAWGTSAENNRDRIRHGTMPRGEEVNTSKLTREQAAEILREMRKPLPPGRKRRPRGFVSALAARYGIRVGNLYEIAAGRHWGHLQCKCSTSSGNTESRS